jgi:hypothetical protein
MPERHQLRRDGPLFKHDHRMYSISLGEGRHKPLTDFNISGGIPLRAGFYFGFALLLVVFVSHLPLLGMPLNAFFLPIRLTVFPGLIAWKLMRTEPDGCVAPTWLAGFIRHRCTSRTRYAGRSVRSAGSPVVLDQQVGIASDVSGPRLRSARITGPARIEFTEDVIVTTGRRGHAVVRLANVQDAGRVAVVDLDAGESLRIAA